MFFLILLDSQNSLWKHLGNKKKKSVIGNLPLAVISKTSASIFYFRTATALYVKAVESVNDIV